MRSDDAFRTRALLERALHGSQVPDLTGERFGPYAVGRVLGRGAMGVVYEATDTLLGRQVALKILTGALPALDDLVREARIAAALEHQNILRVYDAGEHDGIAYFTMQYVDGAPLRTPAPNARRAAQIGLAIASALGFAHGHRTLHRDIKPANVLVDAAGQIFVADFGLAAREGSASPAGAGTPAYMAPEILRDERGGASTAADVWSAGVILYELVSGQHPFDASSWDELVRSVTQEPPRPLSSCPPDLEAICMRCLEKDAAGRYATGSDLADDLTRFLAEQPVRARPLNLGGRALRRVRRHPWVAALAFVLFASTVRAAIDELVLARVRRLNVRVAIRTWGPGTRRRFSRSARGTRSPINALTRTAARRRLPWAKTRRTTSA
ncbi:MAG TPA: serine/threonine-protein kinase [Polyangiaceae bacterium]|nr:serine/threonine-protein kinase [Polyangiaceae bacterium]